MTCEIDLAGVSSREQLHGLLREALALPEHYGNNLDALHDVLSEGAPRDIVFRNADQADGGMTAYIAALRRVFDDLPPSVTVRWEEGGSRFLRRARAMRESHERHYNCAQSVIAAFAEDAGMDAETACRVTANFGSGMKRASVCGAITGGLMALGLFGAEDPATVGEYYRRLRERHDGLFDCGDLLRLNRERGGDRSAHCDGMVYECVSLVEALLRETGRL